MTLQQAGTLLPHALGVVGRGGVRSVVWLGLHREAHRAGGADSWDDTTTAKRVVLASGTVTLSRLPYVVWHYAVAARRVEAIAAVFDTASAGCVDMATWTEGDDAGLGDAKATGVPRSGRRNNELTTDLIKSRASPSLPGPAPLPRHS
jgi:hypothetical protein